MAIPRGKLREKESTGVKSSRGRASGCSSNELLLLQDDLLLHGDELLLVENLGGGVACCELGLRLS